MATNDNNGPSVFAQYIDGPEKEQPQQTKGAIKQPRRGSLPIEMLLDWLINYWTKPTITMRQICIFGPRSVRDKKTTLSLAQTLVDRGWLVRNKTRRRDMYEWQIVIKR